MERDIKELTREFERSKQAAKEQLQELNRLRDYVGCCKDDLRGNFAMDEQAAEKDIVEMRDLNKMERRESTGSVPMHPRKSPFLKRVRGCFGKKSGKSKRKPTAAQPRKEVAGGDNTPTIDWPTNFDHHSQRSSISGIFTFAPNHRRSISLGGIQHLELFSGTFDKDERNMTKDEPIDIDSQPKSQKKEEGSRVEFQFKVRGKHNLMYKWFKDGSELPRQNNDTLVLDCIKLRDFGKYTCEVSYQDRCCVPVKSSPAELDVIPTESQSRTKLKLLQEVDFETREELARMLENGLYSLGDWKQVAAEYGMRERYISGLANSKEPGKNVIEFLGGSHPDLTVYSFCRVLKHQKIRRLDIVKLLEDHF
ncbi:uncharacterized protein LOC111322424 [Stylophora pistillata]|uniref:uncharacterized protein LOC111322424 n=1 Tax=Stylophora pistillata TaxID=50429 RepID=UPI000C047A8D|nr:uncharacterized protein LOC111322424 [Stylophora pistillata]